MRVGYGYDIHALDDSEGPLRLGGHEIAASLSLQGHSDGDVLLHAVADAILGAAALGDLGEQFPEDDDDLRGVDSALLLSQVLEMAKELGYRLHNVDATIVAGRPRLALERRAIAASLSGCCGLDSRSCNVKLKSNEGYDAAGRGEAIAAHAVVSMLEESDD